MPMNQTWAGRLLALQFHNVAAADIGDAGGLQPSATLGSLYLALHSADPLTGGLQSAFELTYTGYARIALPRSAAAFTLSTNLVSLAANVDFGVRTDGGGTQTATHASIGLGASGGTLIMYRGALTTPIPVDQNFFPRVLAGQVIAQT